MVYPIGFANNAEPKGINDLIEAGNTFPNKVDYPVIKPFP
jgi:hypothetical protein